MITVKPFKAIRPRRDVAADVAALPYDVMNSKEAKEMTRDNPLSFLHIDKAEIDLPDGIDIHSDAVYEKALENYNDRKADQTFIQDESPSFYIYRLTLGGVSQTGIVGCPAADDYSAGRIKKHELTRADKEEDRVRHVDKLNANTGPIFLAHRPNSDIDELVSAWTFAHDKEYSFTGPGDVLHEVWVVGDADASDAISRAFAGMDALYIADGHHRCASAVRVCEMRRAAAAPGAFTGDEEFNFFLAVMFPSDQLHILDYNRVVRDLNGHEGAFAEEIERRGEFELTKAEAGAGAVSPISPHEFGMYLSADGRPGGAACWHTLKWRGAAAAGDPVAGLDVSILQDKLLSPILGINDPRTDGRIDFVGGIRGLAELERRVQTDMAVAFSMYPTQMDELMAIADADLIMPPKSTWFEPKLLSGLFIHELD
jgi:uncharacterized protein (DUF1015 family)